MHKAVRFLFLVILAAAMTPSCRKSVLPGAGHPVGTPDTVPILPPPDPTETDPAVLTPVPGTVSPNIQGYYEALPAHYHETSKRYPVIFFFHGGGQYGDGHTHLDTVLAEGIGRLLRDKKFPPSFTVSSGVYSFIVVIPQLKRAVVNSEIDSLVNYSMRKYRIDSSRVYFSGFSLGGRQVADYAAYKPKLIAAVADMAGMLFQDAKYNSKCQSIAANNLPVWQFHAKNDSAWKYTESVKFVNTINGFAPAIPARLTLFDKGIRRLNHDCWTQASDPAYRENGKNIYEWMLGYTR